MKPQFNFPTTSQSKFSYWLTGCVACCILGVVALGLISYTEQKRITGYLSRYSENIVQSPAPFSPLAENGSFLSQDGIIGTTLELEYYHRLLNLKKVVADQTQPPAEDTLVGYYELLGSPDWLELHVNPKVQQKKHKLNRRSTTTRIKGLQHQIEQLEGELAKARNAWVQSQDKAAKDQQLVEIHALESKLNHLRKEITEQIQRSDQPVSEGLISFEQDKKYARIIGSIDSIFQNHAVKIQQDGYIQFLPEAESNKVRGYGLTQDTSIRLWHLQTEESVNLSGLKDRAVLLLTSKNGIVVQAVIQHAEEGKLILNIDKSLQPDEKEIWTMEYVNPTTNQYQLQNLLTWKGSRKGNLRQL